MTSDLLVPAKSAFVWVWLPGATEPVVAGRIDLLRGVYQFTYGQSYLARDNAISIYGPELPLRSGVQVPGAPHMIAGALRDGSPDLWGRRVVYNRLFNRRGANINLDEIDELNYMLLSGSDRIGALDFQASATEYQPRMVADVRLEDLQAAANLIELGRPLPPELEEAIRNGTSIGGARPKAQIMDGELKLIAKFSSTADRYSVVKGEYLAMKLARAAGLNAASVDLVQAGGKDVLVVERFDRAKSDGGWARKAMVSGLTVLDLTEDTARYASYEDLAGRLRRAGKSPTGALRELFGRMSFNILMGNTDDHARNHAAFWDGRFLELTPAYDIDPRPRLGRDANQAMAVHGRERGSRLELALRAAPAFGLTRKTGEDIILSQAEAIMENFPQVSEEAQMQEIDKDAIRGRAVLLDGIFDGLGGPLADSLPARAAAWRNG